MVGEAAVLLEEAAPAERMAAAGGSTAPPPSPAVAARSVGGRSSPSEMDSYLKQQSRRLLVEVASATSQSGSRSSVTDEFGERPLSPLEVEDRVHDAVHDALTRMTMCDPVAPAAAHRSEGGRAVRRRTRTVSDALEDLQGGGARWPSLSESDARPPSRTRFFAETPRGSSVSSFLRGTAHHAERNSNENALAKKLWGSARRVSVRGVTALHWSHPDSFFRQKWIMGVLLATLYCAVELPVDIAFYPGINVFTIKFLFDLLVDVFFVADIYVSFRTGYVEDGVIVMDSKAIKSRYMKSGFFADIVATLPLDVVQAFWATSQSSRKHGLVYAATRLGRIARLSRLLRLARVARFFRYASFLTGGLHEGHVRILTLAFSLVLFARESGVDDYTPIGQVQGFPLRGERMTTTPLLVNRDRPVISTTPNLAGTGTRASSSSRRGSRISTRTGRGSGCSSSRSDPSPRSTSTRSSRPIATCCASATAP